jgi:hypothetical protein
VALSLLAAPLLGPTIPAVFGNSYHSLARALAHSQLWPAEATLAVREEPGPLLAVLGFFDEAHRVRLENLQYQLAHVLPTLRYLDYAAVTAACEALADNLKNDLGSELTSARFTGLPRGGLIVLGILSYVLGLKREQLEAGDGSPLVVVDDCAISGLRFRQFKRHHPEREIIFAPLFSAPELRAAIHAAEPCVRVVSAHDLTDRAREERGNDYDAWQARWRKRSPDAYWIGQPEQVAFPWNEPDVSFWNPVTEREESGWHFLTPEQCLKHRHEPQRIPVYVPPPTPGPLKPNPDLLYGRLGERVLVGHLQTKQGFALEGVAADMFEALLRRGTPEAAASDLADSYAAPLEELTADCRTFADDLVARDLLEVA